MTQNIDKLIVFPNNFDAEQSMLGAIFMDGVVSEEYIPLLTEDDFYNLKHKRIFEAMREVFRRSTVDIITVNDMMEKLHLEKQVKNPKKNYGEFNSEENLIYLSELATNIIPSAANAQFYFDILKRDTVFRTLITGCNEIIEKAYTQKAVDEVIKFAEATIFSISKKMERSDLTHISKALVEFNARLNQMMVNKGAMRGLVTGFNLLDLKTNGLQKGDLIIVAARPSVGKTSFAMNIAANCALKSKEKKNIAIFSLEMPAVQLVQRLICNFSGVTMDEVSSGEVTGSGTENIFKACKILGETSIYIDDSSLQTAEVILSKLRRLSSKTGSVDLVVVDYLQLMDAGKKSSESRQQEITAISRMFKIIAKEINCPVIVLSQMSRGIEGRTDKAPRLSDLRESGAIEQDADIVMFLSREDEKLKDAPSYNVILDLAKHRNGSLGKIRLLWEGPYIRFSESSNQMFHESNNSNKNSNNQN